MSYYWFNREKLLKKIHGINIITKEVKKRLLSIMLLTKKF